MLDMVFTDRQGFNYRRVEKRNARKAHRDGRTVHVFASNLRPFTDWTGCGAVLTADEDFEKFVNTYEWYNCDRFAGCYPSFYVFEPQSEEEKARYLFQKLNEAETFFGRKITDLSVFDTIRFSETATGSKTDMVIHMRQDSEHEELYTLRIGFDLSYGSYLEKTYEGLELAQAFREIRSYMQMFNSSTGTAFDVKEFDEEVVR